MIGLSCCRHRRRHLRQSYSPPCRLQSRQTSTPQLMGAILRALRVLRDDGRGRRFDCASCPPSSSLRHRSLVFRRRRVSSSPDTAPRVLQASTGLFIIHVVTIEIMFFTKPNQIEWAQAMNCSREREKGKERSKEETSRGYRGKRWRPEIYRLRSWSVEALPIVDERRTARLQKFSRSVSLSAVSRIRLGTVTNLQQCDLTEIFLL